MKTLLDRLIEKVEASASGCWEWTGAKIPHGYGSISVGGRTQMGAHRVSYQLFVGPIPAGLQIDHLCRNRGCVNPLHLEPVTPRENQRRGNGVSGLNARRTHCVNGHPFDNENTRIIPKGRECKECKRQAFRDWYARRKEAAI